MTSSLVKNSDLDRIMSCSKSRLGLGIGLGFWGSSLSLLVVVFWFGRFDGLAEGVCWCLLAEPIVLN